MKVDMKQLSNKTHGNSLFLSLQCSVVIELQKSNLIFISLVVKLVHN